MKYTNIYSEFLKKFLAPKRKLKIVLDCSNGSAGPIVKKLFSGNQRLIIRIVNGDSDGNFPAHGPDPSKKTAIRQMKKEVLKYKAELGVAFDSDGDRAIFTDNLGKRVLPDAIAYLIAWNLKPKKMLIDPRTSWLIKKSNFAGNRSKPKILESKVGHYFIKKTMRETNADLAFEGSGHYYFKKFFCADSGILAAIEAVNAVSKLPYSLADFSSLLPRLHRSGEINFPCVQPRKTLKAVEKKYGKSAGKISRLDGLTMEFSYPENFWWFNLRPSNTESLLRLNIESNSEKLLRQKTKELKKIISFY